MKTRSLKISVLGAMLVAAGPAFAGSVADTGIFELDGDPQSEASPGDDWECLYLGTCTSYTRFTGIVEDFIYTKNATQPTTFTGGGSKDIYDIDDGPWMHADGSSQPKDEITDAYAVAYTCPAGNSDCNQGDLLVFFGADRWSNNGDAHFGFWLFQDDVGPVGGGLFSGEHVDGDILVVVEYPQSEGSQPTILVWEWFNVMPNPLPAGTTQVHDHLLQIYNSTAAKCDPAAANQPVCAIANTEELFPPHGLVPSPWPYDSTIEKAGNGKDAVVIGANTFPAETFFEGGINLTQLLGFSPCFSDFLAETRASTSPPATLSDFVGAGFELCEVEGDKACAATLQGGGSSVLVHFYGTVSNPGAQIIRVTVDDDVADIDAVCIDTNGNNTCDGGEASPANLVISGGDATFDLAVGESVLYEGTFTDATPAIDPNTGEFLYEDTATITATEVGSTNVILSETASASCSTPGIPNISITKLCDPVLDGAGSGMVVTVTGTGQNDGQVKLTNVTLSDVPALDTLSICIDGDGITPANGVCGDAEDTAVSNGFDLLAGQYFAYSGTYAEANSPDTTASDTITVNAVNFFNSEDTTSDSETATCSLDINPTLSVVKNCEALLNNNTEVPGYVVLEAHVTGTVTNTGSIAITGITLSDADVPIPDAQNGPFDLAPGATFDIDFHYFPSTVGQELACGVDFDNTISASGTSAFGGAPGAVQASSGEVQCDLCPAECPVPQVN